MKKTQAQEVGKITLCFARFNSGGISETFLRERGRVAKDEGHKTSQLWQKARNRELQPSVWS